MDTSLSGLFSGIATYFADIYMDNGFVVSGIEGEDYYQKDRWSVVCTYRSDDRVNLNTRSLMVNYVLDIFVRKSRGMRRCSGSSIDDNVVLVEIVGAEFAVNYAIL